MENLVSVTTVRERAGFKFNTNITDEQIKGHIDEAHGVVLSYVSSRYDIVTFTDERFGTVAGDKSQAYTMMEKQESDLAVGALLSEDYGVQRLNENNAALVQIDKAEGRLVSISEGHIRLIDLLGKEFGLLQLSPNATTGAVTVGSSVCDPSFNRGQQR